jgi:hypothetical protein
MTFKPQTILYVPDVHAKSGDNLQRFDALAAWLTNRRIKFDSVIQGGDLWDMESLCTHDDTSPEYYERHFWDEFSVGLDAFDKLESFTKRFGNKGCTFYITEGNHENRYNKWMASDNRLRTSPFPQTVDSLLHFYRPTSKVNYFPFLQPLVVHDIAFSHYFVSGLMGRPQGGERPAANILRAQFQSTVSCHSHVLDFAERTRADGSKLYSVVGGCFVDPKAKFAYAGAARKLWWNGVHILHVTAPGEFDVETISLERLQQ